MGRKRQTEKALLELLDQESIQSVLDVGCGSRTYESLFQGVKYKGIDVEVSGRIATEKAPDEYFDGVNIPEREKMYDLVLCTEVLEHCRNPEELMSEIKRVVKVGGFVLITAPSIWGLHEEPFDFRRYTSHGLKDLITNAGMRIARQEKTDEGVYALAKLVASEIVNETSSRRLRYFLGTALVISCMAILKMILGIELKRIYIGNQILAQRVSE
jgi:SAM-dependent methyltransferase